MSEAELWIRREHAAPSRKVIAFIHGIGAGDPEEYWRQFIEVLKNDTNALVRDFDIFVWGYSTHRRPGRAENILSSIVNRTFLEAAPGIKRLAGAWDATYQAQFRDCREVVLICHSMGGLVVKSWIVNLLEKGESSKLDKLRHISFYATPHSGAPIATLTSWNNQLKDMRLNSEFIAELGERWHDHVVAWKDKEHSASDQLHDRYIPHLVIDGISDKVVPYNFATIKGVPHVEVQGNHTEVIRPKDVNDTRYKIWCDNLEETLLPDKAAPSDISPVTVEVDTHQVDANRMEDVNVNPSWTEALSPRSKPNIEALPYIQDLKEALQHRALVLFIGSDLPSAVTGLPSRNDLARNLARHYGINESLSLAEVAQRVSQAGNRYAFTAFIRDALDPVGKSPQTFHKRIVALVQTNQIETLITTAYEYLLELAFQQATKGYNQIISGSDVAFVRVGLPTLIKLYGDVRQPDTLIVTDRDHFDLIHNQDKEAILDEVRRAFRRSTILFLGYNLSDPDFRFLFDQIAQGRFAKTAYAVWTGLDDTDRQMWRDRGIVILDTDPQEILEIIG